MRLALIPFGLCLAALPAFAQEQETGPNGLPIVGGAEMSPEKTIVGNAVNSADHTTLVAAVQAAGLVDTLTGPGPFTVFAPVDSAFAALPDGTVETLLLPQNLDDLQKILTCHVIAADMMRADIQRAMAEEGSTTMGTVGGCNVTFAMDGDTLTLTDPRGTVARVSIRDVEQLNGVIHVIDSVLLPEEAALSIEGEAEVTEDGMRTDNPMTAGNADDTLVDVIAGADDLTQLAAAVEAAGLVDALSGPDPITIFAPNDAAFEAASALPSGDALSALLLAHAVPGTLTAADLASARQRDGFVDLTTLSGDAISIQMRSDPPAVFDENGTIQRIVAADRMAGNGVIHVVDGVLMPR
ncbi:Immunogenic protein MPT70 precursor [Rhodobacteraceae bacterium THAF1]|uniref:fasciclin domain-containing protein n=1 Tax=Palleronia sp. THAF1 TaxID=2587842 RepID=UPI000F3B6789|nr:fasciclin domain-containing protein [Palleronia sp. THAF1]QFU08426.1 Immunogenic protein MPT70 precursor [Palleronia sp. THAF1]VDC29256.1 Immunogenic protein MPT70 precursor [Rhodobacteraceae bacterium THAF1]